MLSRRTSRRVASFGIALFATVAFIGGSAAYAATGSSSEAPGKNGNNGTIKIDGLPFDTGNGNEPHVGCFRVRFIGFDPGQVVDLAIDGHPPTGGGLL